MKFKALFSLLTAFAVFNAFGIGATQEWVRRMLSQYQPLRSSGNITVTGGFNASVMGADYAEATCTISTEIGTHVALKVIASNVSEIPTGSFYAMNPDGHFVNARNTYLSTIYAAPYNSGSVRMANLWSVDSTGKAWRMGIGEDTFIYRTDDPSKRITLRSTKIPARGANSILTAMARGFVAPWLLYADENGELEYTIKSETTIAIGQITFTRKDKNGKVTTVAFTPEDLTGVYKGPNGPFKTKEEARAAAMDLDNWDFGDWIKKFNVDMTSAMTKKDLQNSDAWKFLIDAIESERVEVEIENPQPYQHPCPAPADYWDWSATAKDWVVNPAYDTAEELDKWRGENGCLCGFEGCESAGTAKHRVGRVTKKGGETHFTDDADGGDGCKCCIRCVLYGADDTATIIEFNDHRAAGVDAGSCGCACEMYTSKNESEWPRDFHNRPSRVGGKDFACLCYCGREKAANGEFVQHVKYKGDDPWCEKLCSGCEMVEDKERYITHSWPSFDTRHVTLRAHEWSDHTPRSEAKGGVSVLNDPTFYDRCGCACGIYDEKHSGGLPQEFAAFHQQKAVSCSCHCGQNHTKNTRGESEVDPFPCSEICAVCLKVEDKESDAVFTFNGETYKKLVMRTPTKEADHTKHGILCGCKCYNEVTTRYEWSIGGAVKDSIEADGTMPEFHVMNVAECGCECGGVIPSTLPKAYHTGENTTGKGKCWCVCGEHHTGEWLTKSCGANTWRECSKNPEHIHEEDAAKHEYANGFHSAAGHYCKCDKKIIAPHWNIRQKSGRGEGVITYRLVCQTPGCGWFGDESEVCNHPNWGEWFKAGEIVGGYLMRRNCADCASFEQDIIMLKELTECNTEMNIHLPLEDTCGCKCGHYGVRIAEEEEFHKWDGDNCRCFCESKHHFKTGSACAKVCAGCKTTLKSGATAKESDHTKASGRVCGCACGYYGVTSDHSASGHYAETAYLHKQASAHGNGIPSFCQCYGAEGTGGEWHWRTARSQTCPRICTYKRGDIDPLGHLAARSSPEKGITPAKPEDHAAKTYGCGCKCGLCDEKNRGEWAHQKTLHHAAQNAEDQCHCACESRELVGKTEGHTFKTCICTCGDKHDSKNYPLNACGYCSNCGKIWKGGEPQDASIKSKHSFAQGGCYCDGGCVVGGSKILHPDGHRYMKNKCVCLCSDQVKREHWVVSETKNSGFWSCWDCSAVFLNFTVNSWCSRCGETLPSEHIGSVGEHYPGCGEPNPNSNHSCWKCGCVCATWGSHATCSLHYCSACCYKKPSKPNRPDKPDPENPDDPVPDPPEPYVSCAHVYDDDGGSGDWTCDDCGGYFTYWWSFDYCIKCGHHDNYECGEEGEHGPPCTNNNDPDHVCDYIQCGAETTSGLCTEMYCHSCTSTCPNESNHKSHHGGNGNSGGDGDGNINDIITIIR